MLKLSLLLGLSVIGLLVLALVSSKRDSRYFHWVSQVVAPVTQAFLPQHHAGAEPVVEMFDKSALDSTWIWHQPEAINAEFLPSGLRVTSVAESVWYHNQKGPMLYRYFEGDGEVAVRVETRKSTAPQSFPDTEWQFAGLMFRNPAGDAWFSRENYVFNVIGFRRSGLQLEVKTTRDGRSDVSAFDWASGDADLLIERRGAVFTLKAKALDALEWHMIAEYVRPDLPALLQVGMIVYSYSEGRQVFDLQADFNHFRLRAL